MMARLNVAHERQGNEAEAEEHEEDVQAGKTPAQLQFKEWTRFFLEFSELQITG